MPGWIGPTTIDFDAAPSGTFMSMTIGNTKFIGLDGPLDISVNYNGQYNALGVKSRKALPIAYAAIEGKTSGLPLFDSIHLLGR